MRAGLLGAFAKRGEARNTAVSGEGHAWERRASEKGENGGMDTRQNELKATLMKDAEAEIDGMLKWDEATGRVLTVQEMEDRLLEIRQRLGERLMERLLEYQTSKEQGVAPVSEENGKRLQNKGKKTTKS
jgi:hypothetical protein